MKRRSDRRDEALSWHASDVVQTPLGKGTLLEVRSNGRMLVQVRERTVLLPQHEVSRAETPSSRHRRAPARTAPPTTRDPGRSGSRAASSVDLHGMTVDEALAQVDLALNDALLADVPTLRLIHGRSGGRIRTALHRHLRGIPNVRRFFVDPSNAGVTIVEL